MSRAVDSSSSPVGEESLLASLRLGDDEAFAELVRTRGGRMLAVARRILHDEDAAQDAVQEAFTSAWRALGSFDGACRLSTWLHRIVVNACLMKMRSQKRKPETSIEDLLPSFLDDGHRRESGPNWRESAVEEALESVEARKLVRLAIDELPEAHRVVLVLRDIEEFDTEECARMLGISSNAAKVRLHRARLALREHLAPHFEANP